MSAATEQNNGDVAVEKVAAPAADAVDVAAVKDELKSKPAVDEASTPVTSDNGTTSKEKSDTEKSDAPPAKEHKGQKRSAEAIFAAALKAKKAKAPEPEPEGDSDEEEIIEDLNEDDSESDDYDIPYDGEEDDIECDDDDDENDDGSGSDDQA